MKTLIFTLSFSLSCFFSDAQTVGYSSIKTQNGGGTDATNDVVVSSDNFVYACGNFTSNPLTIGVTTLSNSGSSDIYLCKYDTSGALLWARKYGGTGIDNSNTITADSLGNIYMAGSCGGPVNFGSLSFAGGNFILKIDATGTEQWVSAAANNVTINDIASDPQGNAVICGNFVGSASIGGIAVSAHGSNDGFVAKYNTAGNFTWMKIFYNNGYERCNGIAVAPSGLIGVGGDYNSANKLYIGNATTLDSMASTFVNDPLHPGPGTMGFVCCLQANGNYSWAKDNLNTNDGYHYATVTSVAASSSDNFYFATYISSRGLGNSFHTGSIRKYNSSGTLIFNKGLSFKSLALAFLGGFLKPTVTFNNNKIYGADNNVVSNFTAFSQLYALRAFDDNGNALWNTVETSSPINALAVTGDAVFAGGTLTGSTFGNLTAPFAGGTDGFLCIANAPVTITPLALNSPIPDGSFCPGGSVTLAQSNTVSGGVFPYTYQWSPATGLSNANILTPVATPALTTNYILTITDAVGTILRDTVTVNALPQLSKPTISLITGPTMDTLVCSSSYANLQYLWSNGPVTSVPKLAIGQMHRIYTVSIRQLANNGCAANSDSFYYRTVRANAGRDTTICAGQSVILGGTPEYYGTSIDSVMYAWLPVSPSTLNNPFAMHPVATPTITTDYVMIVHVNTNANINYAYIYDTVRVTVVQGNNTIPTVTPSGATSFCQGDSVTLTSSPGNSYLWNTGATTQSITVHTGGDYSVQISNSLGCTSVFSQPVTVIVNALPATPSITAGGPTSFCQGGNVTLISTIANSYLWSNGETTQSINVDNSGTFTVTTTNSVGCLSHVSVPLTVTVNPLPSAPSITPSGTTTFCQGGNVSLSSSPGNNFLWSTGETTQNINVNSSGIYSVQIINTNGCTSPGSAPVTVTVDPLPTTPSITASGPTSFCQGGNVILTSTIANSYMWSNGETTQSIIANNSGIFTVTTTNSFGCTSPASVPLAVTVNPIPATPTITPSGTTTFCQGGNIFLGSSPENSYLWNTGATTQNINVNSSGTYSVQITNANGCTSAASLSMVVTVNPLPSTPVINGGGPTTFCAGGNVILNSSAANSYLWNTGASAQNINVNTSGNYSVQITDVNGCRSSTSAPILVTVNPLPVKPTITQTGNTLISTPESGYQWYLTGNPISGATGQSYTSTTGSTYSVMVTNIFGCSIVSDDYVATLMLPGENDFFHRVSPNPVQSNAVIQYELKNIATVNIFILDQMGTKVVTLINDVQQQAGKHQYIFRPGRFSLNSGYYFIVYVVDGKTVTEKIYIK